MASNTTLQAASPPVYMLNRVTSWCRRKPSGVPKRTLLRSRTVRVHMHAGHAWRLGSARAPCQHAGSPCLIACSASQAAFHPCRRAGSRARISATRRSSTLSIFALLLGHRLHVSVPCAPCNVAQRLSSALERRAMIRAWSHAHACQRHQFLEFQKCCRSTLPLQASIYVVPCKCLQMQCPEPCMSAGPARSDLQARAPDGRTARPTQCRAQRGLCQRWQAAQGQEELCSIIEPPAGWLVVCHDHILPQQGGSLIRRRL